jgi:hypothetical protein
MDSPDAILAILDACCDAFTFPMLDNGYVYPCAARMSLFRGASDWAIVIETFGFSPRAGLPDTSVSTFASRLHARNTPDDYVSREAYERYLSTHPHNEFRSVFPIEDGPWIQDELVVPDVANVLVRGNAVAIPPRGVYANHGIVLEDPNEIQVFELCRYLASIARDAVLATPAERRISVAPEMTELLVLDEWHHPNVVDDEERPSGSETFRQLAEVLVTGDASRYRPTRPPNTHWSNWPDGGTL